jgi:hypothetical protein
MSLYEHCLSGECYEAESLRDLSKKTGISQHKARTYWYRIKEKKKEV